MDFDVISIPEELRRKAAEWPELPEPCTVCGARDDSPAEDEVTITETWMACPYPHAPWSGESAYPCRCLAEMDAERRGWEYVEKILWCPEDAEHLGVDYYRAGSPDPLPLTED